MTRLLYRGLAGREERLQVFYALVFFVLVCLAYFVLHRLVYMRLLDITFPEGSLYRFDVSAEPWGNFKRFALQILPVMLNLWSPAPALAVAAGVLLAIVPLAALRLCRTWGPANADETIGRLVIAGSAWGLLFLAANTPGLLAAGRPPEFYRAWHPGMAAIVLALWYAVGAIRPQGLGRGLLAFALVIACGLAFHSSRYLASTLSAQFTYAREQIRSQFSPDRERYVIVERRAPSRLFGRPRWGELGFLHIFSAGHLNYVLTYHLGSDATPALDSVVAKHRDNPLLLEPDLLQASLTLFAISPREATNRPSLGAFDHRIDTFFESTAPLPVVLEATGERPAAVACYRLHAGTGESPERTPRAWRLAGSDDLRTWSVLDARTDQAGWREGESRLFELMQPRRYKHYRLEVLASNHPGVVRVAELQLFVRPGACRMHALTSEGLVDPGTLKSINAGAAGMRVRLAGMVSESGLSDPPFRIQRALDDIYYTFWETLAHFPVRADFGLFASKAVRCYALQAGEDRAHDRMPKSWRLLGSEDGLQWTLLDARDGETAWTDNARRAYPVAAPRAYRNYRLEFLSINGGTHLRVYEIFLSENPYCDEP
jgi:hypothetical protein